MVARQIDIHLRIFDRSLVILADMQRAKLLCGIPPERLIEIDAVYGASSAVTCDIGNVLGAGNRAAANHGKTKEARFP